MRRVASQPVVAILEPSGLKTARLTTHRPPGTQWRPRMTSSCRPVAASKIRALPSAPAVAMREPSGLTSIPMTARTRAGVRDAPHRVRVAAERQGLAELSAPHIPGLREPVYASGGDVPPVAAELDVEDRSPMGVNYVELLPRRQPVQ